MKKNFPKQQLRHPRLYQRILHGHGYPPSVREICAEMDLFPLDRNTAHLKKKAAGGGLSRAG